MLWFFKFRNTRFYIKATVCGNICRELGKISFKTIFILRATSFLFCLFFCHVHSTHLCFPRYAWNSWTSEVHFGGRGNLELTLHNG